VQHRRYPGNLRTCSLRSNLAKIWIICDALPIDANPLKFAMDKLKLCTYFARLPAHRLSSSSNCFRIAFMRCVRRLSVVPVALGRLGLLVLVLSASAKQAASYILA
jgi:hypothetical protein